MLSKDERICCLLKLWNLILSLDSTEPKTLAAELGILGVTDVVVNAVLQLKGDNILVALKDIGFTHESGVCNTDNYSHFLKICMLGLLRSNDRAKKIYVVLLSTILKKIERDSVKGIAGFKFDAKHLVNNSKKFTLK
jgi:hypothetical protein